MSRRIHPPAAMLGDGRYVVDGVVYRAGRRCWSAAEDAQIRRDYPDTPTTDLARRMGRPLTTVYQRARKLGVEKSAAYLASPHACRLRRGDHVGRRFWYPKGHVPANKGLRRPGYAVGRGRMQETQFKKGVRVGVATKLYKAIGSERISKDGYLERKVNDDLPLQARWRAVHLIVWEAVHGRIPPGHALVFKNRDRQDIRLDNLELITRRELMRRNTIHNLPRDVKGAITALSALNKQIRKRSGREQSN